MLRLDEATNSPYTSMKYFGVPQTEVLFAGIGFRNIHSKSARTMKSSVLKKNIKVYINQRKHVCSSRRSDSVQTDPK